MSKIFGDRFADSFGTGIDMPNWDLGELGAGAISAFGSESVTITANDHTYILTGEHFTFEITDETVTLTGGTIHQLDVFPIPLTDSPHAELTITEFTMHVADFNGFVAADDVAGFQTALFSHGDHLRGAGGIDHLTGLTGNDTLAGGSGDDVLIGGQGRDALQGDRGADTLSGGEGADKFVFDGAKDSGGGVYDTIMKFKTGQDHIVCSGGGVTGIDTQVDAGVSNSFNVDPALAAALDADHLGAHHAVVATVQIDIGGPDITFQTFLVVDVNGVAGYQSGEDIAVIIANPHSLNELSVDDFFPTH